MLTDEQLHQARILVIDDEPPNVRLLEAILQKSGYASVRSTTDSRQAVAIYREFRPDAVLLDLRMPHLDGFEVMEQLREAEGGSYAPVLVLTVMDDVPTRLRALAAGARDFIAKPFNIGEVLLRTRNLIETRLLHQQTAFAKRSLEAILDAIGDAIAMFDTDGRLLFANGRFASMFGLQDETLEGIEELRSRLKAFFQDSDAYERSDSAFFSDPECVLQDILETTTPNRRMLYRYTAPVRDAGGDLLGRLLLYRDVSQDIEIEQMTSEVQRLRAQLDVQEPFPNIIGQSRTMQEVFALIRLSAESNITVLIQGESGTGKELVAKAIHTTGARRRGPFVAINCAAIPEALIESELFGHERGAFTGANTRRIGKFEQANGGTILLDEIAEMPHPLQGKLLRVLQEREIQRIGDGASIPIDVRVIAATNRDLPARVQAGQFREDLYYRLSAFPIVVPPLRERTEDIPALADRFLARCARETRRPITSISPGACQALLEYHWPGNVRELENVIARATLLETSGVLTAGSLPSYLLPQPAGSRPTAAHADLSLMTLDELEKRAIQRTLEATRGNLSQSAATLGIDRTTLYRKLKRYSLPS